MVAGKSAGRAAENGMHRGHDRLKPVLLLDKVSNRGVHVVDVGVGQPRGDAEPERVTTAADGVLGIIPDSMAAPGFLVRGRGVAASLHSASHGAGLRMSRTKARETYRWQHVRGLLRERGVELLSAGIDEVPTPTRTSMTSWQRRPISSSRSAGSTRGS